jgi:undecaprenyl-diphosphatase
MTWLEAVLLGVVQGLTEFLPVSSDGHLSAAEMFLPRFQQVGVLFDVLTHVGTLAAIVVYFRRVLAHEASALVSRVPGDRRSAAKLAGLVLLASVPTAIVGLLLKPLVEEMKTDARFVGGMEIATGLAVLSWTVARRGDRRERESMRATDALAIGVAQGLAVLPGLSRSASTIAVGLALGLSGTWAARFSLLAAIPAILGAAGLELLAAWDERGSGFFATGDFAKYLAAAAVASIVGYLTIGWLLRLAANRRVVLFAVYCFLFGLALIAVGWTGAFP